MTLSGVLAPLPTPLDDRDRVDLVRLRAAFPRWLASPLAGFVVLGSSGEAGLLDDDESDRVVGEARALVPSDRRFIVGTGRESTQAAVRAAGRAGDLGADAVLVRTPSVFKSQMTDEALVRYYRAVADTSAVPVLLYNFTALTGVTLRPAVVAELSEHPNIVGIKESGSDTSRIADLVASTRPPFVVLAGSGSAFLGALGAGATGGILAVAGVLPDPCARVFALVQAGRQDEAGEVQRKLRPIAALISQHGVPSLKASLMLVGTDVGLPRPPLVPVSQDVVASLREALIPFERTTPTLESAHAAEVGTQLR